MNAENTKKVEGFKVEVKTMSEVELFVYMDGFGGAAWREEHGYEKGTFEVSEEVFNENQEYYSEMEKVILQELTRFNVDPESVSHGEKGSYWRWYKHWKAWMKSFSDEEWKKVESELCRKDKDNRNLEPFLPKTDWLGFKVS